MFSGKQECLGLGKSVSGNRSLAAFAVLLAVFILVNGLLWFGYSDRKISLALTLISLFCFALIFLCIVRKPTRFTADCAPFLISLTVLGVLFCIVFAPFSVPDEEYHYLASYNYSNFIMGKGFSNDTTMLMRSDDADLVLGYDAKLELEDYDEVTDELTEIDSNSFREKTVDTGRGHGLTNNPPQEKIVSALGLTLARVLNCSSYITFYVGRICNLAMYIFLFFLAYRFAPIGKNIVAIIGLLPMSLHLAASYSYDAFIIPMGVLLTSLIFRSILREEPVGYGELIGIVLVAALLAPCKTIYSFIALLALFIPKKRFVSNKHAVFIKLTCALVVFAVLCLFELSNIIGTMVHVDSNAQGAQYLRDGVTAGTRYTLGDVLANPIYFLILFVRTFDTKGTFYITTMLGGSLGWFQGEIESPGWFEDILLLILAISIVKTSCDDVDLPVPVRIASIAIFAFGTLASMASMLFEHTFNYELVIEGVQGRYLLPYLFLFLAAVRPRSLRFNLDSSGYLLLSIVAANMLNLIRIFSIVLVL